MIGEFSLRAARRRMRKKITAPSMLLNDGTWLTDSWQIASWVDNEVKGNFFRGEVGLISELNGMSERFLSLLRPVVLERMVSEYPLSLEENLPSLFPRALHRPLRSVGGVGIRFLLQKYERPNVDQEEITRLLGDFRRAIGDKETVLEEGFSYADILISTALQMVRPVSRKYWSIGPATREAWTLTEYEDQAKDLLEWRDRTFETFRLTTSEDVSVSTQIRT